MLFLPERYRRALALGADVVPIGVRLAVPITPAALESWINYVWAVGDPLDFPPATLAWDLFRLFGPAGEAMYADLREVAGDDSDPPLWSTFDRPRAPSDRLLIDVMDDACAAGWEAPAGVAAAIDGLRDMADAARVAEREREEIEWQAAADADHAEWFGSGAPDELAIAVERRRAARSQTMAVVPFPSAAPAPKLILSGAEFVADFQPPSYLLDGVLQRRFCYAMTAATGAGKTAIALRLAAHVGLGRKLGDRDVERGRVLYFASENYVDVQARWIAMAEHMRFDIGGADVHFVAGATRLSEIAERITCEVEAAGQDLALVIVDTSAATFEGDDENSNVAAIEHAKRMRSLTTLRGGPTVLVLAHPTKRATADDLIPRGGGAFLAEIDGNLCARKTDSAVELHWIGKFRGPDFAPMLFELRTVTAERLRDARGRPMPTVLAAPLDEAGRAAMAVQGRRDEDLVLRAIDGHPGASASDLARVLGWAMRDGQPYKVRVRRTTEKLVVAKLISRDRDAWTLTARGQQELNRLDRTGTTCVPVMPVLPPRKTP